LMVIEQRQPQTVNRTHVISNISVYK
jgi:hypothetical protein